MRRPANVGLGVMITTLCGTCTGWVGKALVSDPYAGMLWPFVLVIGVFPTLAGIALIISGLRIMRRPKP